jgi:CRISPR/Cas system-associated protein Cas5 (RAMP superfamily)
MQCGVRGAVQNKNQKLILKLPSKKEPKNESSMNESVQRFVENEKNEKKKKKKKKKKKNILETKRNALKSNERQTFGPASWFQNLANRAPNVEVIVRVDRKFLRGERNFELLAELFTSLFTRLLLQNNPPKMSSNTSCVRCG